MTFHDEMTTVYPAHDVVANGQTVVFPILDDVRCPLDADAARPLRGHLRSIEVRAIGSPAIVRFHPCDPVTYDAGSVVRWDAAPGETLARTVWVTAPETFGHVIVTTLREPLDIDVE